MYNSFIHEKSIRRHKTNQTQTKLNLTERNKYLSIRDNLVQKYNKRIQNFIYKMQQNPMQVKSYQDLQNSSQKYRHRSTKNDFIFKKSHWASLQKSFDSKNESKNKQEINKQYVSQSLYNPVKQNSFRSRIKAKEIQIQPMRFNYVPKFLKRMRVNNESVKKTEEEDGTSNVESEDDVFSVASRLSKRVMFPGFGLSTVKTKTSKSKEEEMKNDIDDEESRDINKLYFKAVVDLSHKEKRLSKTAKEVLHKCKVVNYKHTKDESQKDMFDTYNKEG